MSRIGARWGLAAVVLACTSQIEFWLTISPGVGLPALQAAAWAAVAIAMAFTAVWPVAVLLVQIALIDAVAAVTAPRDVLSAFAAILVAVFAVAASTSTVRSVPVLGVAVLGIGLHMTRDPAIRTQFQVVFELFVVFAVAGAGWAVHDRQRRLDLSTMRAQALERDREASVQEALGRERARIAREIHDVLAHDLSVMVLQAGVVRQAVDEQRPLPREPLVVVEQTGREALTELRRLLQLMRHDDEPGPLAPQPTLRNVPDLVERMGASGLPVDVDVRGSPRPLPQDLELSAFRIMQESLTNVLKHAHATRAEVQLTYAPDRLHILVRDDGRPAGSSRAGVGHGLIGLRERAALFGGTLEAHAIDSGGFCVQATLLTEGRPR